MNEKKLLVLLGVVLLIISFGLGFLLVEGYGKGIEKWLITQIPLPFWLDKLVLPIHQKELSTSEISFNNAFLLQADFTKPVTTFMPESH